jgi:CubicO group peptidase (beta-lactamase class C family)
MDLESQRPMTPGTMFRIASMTKPVIGVSIMMMVEEGKLRLNDPVSRFIPEFHVMKVGADRVAAQRDITVKDLLTHVSGLGSGPVGGADIAKVARQEGERWPTASRASARLRSSSSRDRAGPTVRGPASRLSGESSRSRPGRRSISFSLGASSIRSG